MCAHTAEEEAANEETHITFLLYTHHKNDGANKHLALILTRLNYTPKKRLLRWSMFAKYTNLDLCSLLKLTLYIATEK